MKTVTLIFILCALWIMSCTPPHYSVSVARGPTHITFAQRYHDWTDNDYLVDCRLDANGYPVDCVIVDLKGED